MSGRPTLQFLGGTGTVTGSKFLVTSGSTRILVDCGLYQGVRELRERNWSAPPFSPAALDAVVLTHAHIDHCGYLPRLVTAGFDGPVFATPTTCDLAGVVLPDCGHLNEEEAEYANRARYSRHDPALPLYTEDDARSALTHLRPLAFGQDREISAHSSVRLSRAGHILGAASVAVHLGDGASTFVFSGDLGRPNHPLLVPPDPPPACDYLIVESTYGDRSHDAEDGEDLLTDVIRTTVDRGGSVLVPAFAVDRTEVLLHRLAALYRLGKVPRTVPVYVDSPMALAALGIYRAAIARGDDDIRAGIGGRGADPFDIPELVAVSDVGASKALNRPDRPSIIISAAGMASGGRVVHHLAHMLPDRRHTVLLVGYQAVGTRGRQLLEGAGELKMMGRYIPVRAQVVDAPLFSVHADAGELVAWVRSCPTPPDTVFAVHGEPQSSRALARAVREDVGWTAVVPGFGEIVTAPPSPLQRGHSRGADERVVDER